MEYLRPIDRPHRGGGCTLSLVAVPSTLPTQSPALQPRTAGAPWWEASAGFLNTLRVPSPR
jgi:hypothetical protein